MFCVGDNPLEYEDIVRLFLSANRGLNDKDRTRLEKMSSQIYIFKRIRTDVGLELLVSGPSGDLYTVAVDSSVRCTCPDFLYRRVSCEHVVDLTLSRPLLTPLDFHYHSQALS